MVAKTITLRKIDIWDNVEILVYIFMDRQRLCTFMDRQKWIFMKIYGNALWIKNWTLLEILMFLQVENNGFSVDHRGGLEEWGLFIDMKGCMYDVYSFEMCPPNYFVYKSLIMKAISWWTS